MRKLFTTDVILRYGGTGPWPLAVTCTVTGDIIEASLHRTWDTFQRAQTSLLVVKRKDSWEQRGILLLCKFRRERKKRRHTLHLSSCNHYVFMYDCRSERLLEYTFETLRCEMFSRCLQLLPVFCWTTQLSPS